MKIFNLLASNIFMTEDVGKCLPSLPGRDIVIRCMKCLIYLPETMTEGV